jgi:hypothetical protein
MSAYDVFNARNAVGAIVYLDGLVAALDARITALENPEMLVAPMEKTEEVDNGVSDADPDGVRDRAVNDVHGLDDGERGLALDPKRTGGE